MIGINDPIRAPTRVIIGRVALVVEDDDGRHYALTARHLVESFDEPLLLGQDFPESSGSRSEDLLQDGAEEPMCQAIGRLEIAEGEIVSNRPLLSTIELSTDPGVGDGVRRLTASGASEGGIIDGVGGMVKISNPVTGRSAVFYGAIRIAFEGNGAVLESGAAGGLVLDNHGRPLGVIITGKRGRCYVAPLEPYLRKHGLEPVTVRDTYKSRSVLDALFGDLDAFAEALRQRRNQNAFIDVDPPAELKQLARSVDHAARP